MKVLPGTSRVIRQEWLQESLVWKIGWGMFRRARRRCDQAARQSVVVKALARSVGSFRAFPQQAMGYVVAGGLCALVGLMVFGSRSLGIWAGAVRSILFLVMVAVMIRCAESAGK